MEKISIFLVISIIHWGNKAIVTHITLFFDKANRLTGVFGLQKTYLSR